jgi:hypothetical protein
MSANSAQIRLDEAAAGWRELAVEISSIMKLHDSPPRGRVWPLVLGVILFVGTAVPVAMWPTPPIPVENLPAAAAVALPPAPPRVTPPRPPEKTILHKRHKSKKRLPLQSR